MSSVITERTVAVSSIPASPPSLVDVEALLTPVAGENPAGEDLRYSGLHDEIREARRAEDNLPQGDWQREPKAAQWPKVVELTTGALANKSKDLQICAWLSEALVHLYGFVGLRDGLKLMRGLQERFWDRLHPELDGGDMDARANVLSSLDKALEIPLKSLPLTRSGSGTDYSYIQWEESTKFDFPENLDSLDAESSERLTQLKTQSEAEKRITGEAWRKAKGASRRAFYEDTYLVINECWHEFEALDKVIDEKFGHQTPGLGILQKTLDSVRTLVEKVVKEKRILEPDPVNDTGSSNGTGEIVQTTVTITGPVGSREEAMKRLAEVAHYFQMTEPHSPVSYLIQRAIKWGEMPLELWLEDVIKDGSVLDHLRETLGLKPPFQPKGS